MQRNLSPLTILISLFFAMIFWGYVSLNAVYTTYTNFQLRVLLPQDRALANALPSSVFIKVRGTGWQLMNLLYFPGSRVECVVDVSRIAPQIRDTYILNKQEILAGLQTPVAVDVLDVTPENIRFSTDVIAEKSVPVEPAINLEFRNGFIPVSTMALSPDSITIRGSRSALANIHSWKTAPVDVRDVYKNFTVRVPLADHMHNFVRPSRRTITISGEVQQMAEIEVPDIPVEILNAPVGHAHRIRPEKVSVIVRGGVYHLEALSPRSFRAAVDFFSLASDSSGYVRPRLIGPSHITILKTSPQILRHTVETPQDMASQRGL